MWCSSPWRIDRIAPVLALACGAAGLAWAQAAGPGAAVGAATAAAPAVRPSGPASPAAAGAPPQLPGSRLQGEGRMRYWGWQVYHARLWALPDFRPEALGQQPLVLELDYQLDLQGRAIAERSLQEMRRSDGWPEARAAGWLAEMQRLFPDVRAGDRLSGHYQPGQGIGFWHNGRPIGRVPDPDFARRFVGIWLAPTTSEPALRQALLGQPPVHRRSTPPAPEAR